MSGISVVESRRLLTASIPDGAAGYLGLYTELPRRDGTGGTEAAAAWYARVSHSAWRSNEYTSTGRVRRVNVGSVTFSAVTGEIAVIKGWGYFTAASGGAPRHWGPVRNSSGVEQIFTIPVGDVMRWQDGDLIVAEFVPVRDQLAAGDSTVTTTTIGPTRTTNATPSPVSLYAVIDQEAITVEAVIYARHVDGGAVRHYQRRIVALYARDTTTALWSLREQTVDGADTRIGLTTATASLGISSNAIRVTYTGEAATNLDWYTTYTVYTDDPA